MSLGIKPYPTVIHVFDRSPSRIKSPTSFFFGISWIATYVLLVHSPVMVKVGIHININSEHALTRQASIGYDTRYQVCNRIALGCAISVASLQYHIHIASVLPHHQSKTTMMQYCLYPNPCSIAKCYILYSGS